MGSFKLGKMTLRSVFKEPETILYPVVQKPHPEGLKGHIDNDMDVCILCGICEKTCPAAAIVVNKESKSWAIDRFRCVQCGACTRACPKDCLIMEPEYQKPQANMGIDTLYKAEAEAEADALQDTEKAVAE